MDIAYDARGFLTVRGSRVRVPVSGEFRVRADPGPGSFTGYLALDPASAERGLLGVRVLRAAVRIVTVAPVAGAVDSAGRMSATVTVDAVLETIRVLGWTVLRGGSCRTAAHAVVPLRSEPGFSMERGGRVTGVYERPPFTGCAWLTPLVNLLAAGPGNTVVIDLVPRAS